jgi:hypothetical protein
MKKGKGERVGGGNVSDEAEKRRDEQAATSNEPSY